MDLTTKVFVCLGIVLVVLFFWPAQLPWERDLEELEDEEDDQDKPNSRKF